MANRVSGGSATFVALAATAAVASSGAAAVTRTAVRVSSPRTMVVTDAPIAGLAVEGNTLAWLSGEGGAIWFFDLVKRKVVSRVEIGKPPFVFQVAALTGTEACRS